MATVDVQVLMAVIETYGDQRQGFGWAAAREDGDSAGKYTVEGEKCLAIIRSMLAPVAPDPGLREAIARRMFADADAIAVEQGDRTLCWEDYAHQDWYYRRADSAIAVLAERGMA